VTLPLILRFKNRKNCIEGELEKNCPVGIKQQSLTQLLKKRIAMAKAGGII
jgi:hypothetical protein